MTSPTWNGIRPAQWSHRGRDQWENTIQGKWQELEREQRELQKCPEKWHLKISWEWSQAVINIMWIRVGLVRCNHYCRSKKGRSCFQNWVTKNRKSMKRIFSKDYHFSISVRPGMKAGEWWGGTGGGVPRHVSEPLLLCICCYPIIVSTSHIAHRYSIYFSDDNLVGQLTCCYPICFEGFQACW